MGLRSMLSNVFGYERASFSASSGGGNASSISDLLASINEGAIARPGPTLVCRACGLKYENLGTFFHGSPCPVCQPESHDA